MGLFSKLLGRQRTDMKDAALIYAKSMAQSRQPMFYAAGRFTDNYDGRIDCLTLHLTIIMKRLREFGENGQILSQSIFDTLRDDFEVALREEGLSDKGVAKRIKPMIRLFYDRLKAYDEALVQGVLKQTIAQKLEIDSRSNEVAILGRYGEHFSKVLAERSLGDIARGNFNFPMLENSNHQ